MTSVMTYGTPALLASFWLVYGTMLLATLCSIIVWMVYSPTWLIDAPDLPWPLLVLWGLCIAIWGAVCWPITWMLFFGGDGRWRG